MAFYKGKINKSSLFDTIISLLTRIPTGATEPYWKEIQSSEGDGVILYSKGKSGRDHIYLSFRPGLSTTENYIEISFMEKYIPNEVQGIQGEIQNEFPPVGIRYVSHTYSYSDTYPVEYVLSFDKDKIMLSLSGDSNISNSIKSFGWIGLPQRVSNEPDSSSVCMAVSQYAGEIMGYRWNATTTAARAVRGYNSRARSIKNRSKDLHPNINMLTPLGLEASRGWGDYITLPYLYLEDDNGKEGVRAVLDGVYPIYSPESFQDGDEIIVNSKRYTIMDSNQEVGTGSNSLGAGRVSSFPTRFLAIEQLL